MKKNKYSELLRKRSTVGLCLIGLALGLCTSACSDFDDLNRDPFAAGPDQTQIEYFINSSIVGAQQNPDVAERAFVLYWKDAAHFDRIGTLSEGGTDDGWTNAYYNQSSTWQSNIAAAIELYEYKKESGTLAEYEENLYQVARIWRAYLMSEFSDLFGPLPLKAFQGVNPDFNSTRDVYDFVLRELMEATAAINPSFPVANKDLDPAYGYDLKKWVRFGNSLRMRLAMRLINSDPKKAQEEFESAVSTGEYIKSAEDIFSVQELDGWSELSGVMSRPWNIQFLSATINNLSLGLGGIESRELLVPFQGEITSAIAARESLRKQQEADKASGKDVTVYPELKVKYLAQDEMGLYFPEHFATKTNDPGAGYFAEGLPYSIDPRMYKIFSIPGNTSNAHYWVYPYNADVTNATVRTLLDKKDKEKTLKTIDGAFTWNAYVGGNWKGKGEYNRLVYYSTQPRLAKDFRTSTMRRVFFGDWESFFLIAEAGLYGWAVPMEAKVAYEAGIKASFNYWDRVMPDSYNVSTYLSRYLSSRSYSRVGTSVAWDHTAEPPTSMRMKRVNGYTDKEETFEYHYPTNNLYKNGAVRNDHLTKIITQKYLAQLPWLPLEAWSDQRRLGLPFFENPAIEDKIENLPGLTDANYMESNWSNFPMRLKYPSTLANNVPDGYKQAIGLLVGPDEISTPLFWSKAAVKK